ncbi:MAG: hypothetical protein H7281_06125 [Bacteriovorax sp.]|nr:hypothetical protein [Bacteriovorax sp.]
MNIKALTLTFLLILSTQASANDSQYLIKEMEALRDSLEIQDPARVDLTLRLADLYFDVSIQEGLGSDLEVQKKNRLKALDLYKSSLLGSDHLKKATGLNKIKIQFQMGRLLSRLNEGKMAEPYYLEILADSEAPKKMMEQSALALAEFYEEETKFDNARKYYDKAIANCADRNSCNYANYRLAWLYYKDTKLDAAIAAMEKSLWTDVGVIRENSLTDLILFISNKETDGQKELVMIKKIAITGKRPELTRLLVEAFYVAGNRFAGSNLLADLNKSDPNLYYEVRLLEEFYGFRKWDKVENYLSIVEKRKPSDIPLKAEEAKEIVTILRRFIVQVDAEMQVVPELKVFLKRSIDTYLNLYPNDELRKKMQAGWLAVEDDKIKKLSKLNTWIKEDISFKVAPAELRKLRQTRLALAQEHKISALVIEDSLAIAEILKGSRDADEFLYVAAREQYAQKKYELALSNFQVVVTNAKSRSEIVNWTILSQNLILDIYNTQKNYDGIISQAGLWKGMVGENATAEIKKESKSIEQILVQAQFEKAFLMKESIVAMEYFYNFCLADQYVEKSCPNAKVLTLKFKEQDKLVKILEKMKDENGLVVEYELMGRYADAARLREKLELKTKPSIESFLKVAFLFELDQQNSERDRILNLMVESSKREKNLPSELEKNVFAALDVAGLLDERALAMPWSISMKLKMASRLQIQKPSVEAQKILLSSNTEGGGPAWSKAVLSVLEAEYIKTNRIKFYGSRSKILFKQRTASIDKFAAVAKPMLDGADLETRTYILHMLKMTYKNMANEILNTPIPEGLDEKTLASVTGQISTMADPFDRVNEDYDKLLTEQLAAMTDVPLKENVTKNLAGTVVNYASFIKLNLADHKTLAAIDYNTANQMRKKLLTDPEDKVTLVGLKDFYTKNENARLAAYYAGRVDNLKQVE